MTIVDPSNKRAIAIKTAEFKAVAADNYEITIVGANGGPITREWNVKEGKFPTLSSATAKAAVPPRYDEGINFDFGSGDPVLTVRIRSNVKTN